MDMRKNIIMNFGLETLLKVFNDEIRYLKREIW